MAKLFLGCDPDCHTPAFAVAKKTARGSIEPVVVWVYRVSATHKGQEALEVFIGNPQDYHLKVLPWVYEEFAVHEWGGVVTEGQQIYRRNKEHKVDPQDIVHVGQWAGTCAFMAMAITNAERLPVRIPRPSQWKGEVPKFAHQARMLDKMGITYTRGGSQKRGSENKAYCVPDEEYRKLFPTADGSKLLKSDWKHVLDAYALAKWGAENL